MQTYWLNGELKEQVDVDNNSDRNMPEDFGVQMDTFYMRDSKITDSVSEL